MTGPWMRWHLPGLQAGPAFESVSSFLWLMACFGVAVLLAVIILALSERDDP
jgi:hypothetical protein